MDTIAAIAAGGSAPSAIGVIRVSGPDCSPKGRAERKTRRMVLGETLDREDRRIRAQAGDYRRYVGEE